MNKVQLAATLLGAALAVTGCSKKDDPDQAKAPAPAPHPAAPAPAPVATPPAGGGSVAGGAPPAAGAMTELKEIGLQTPESVLHVADQDIYLVSNINGKPADLDDNGFISKLDPDGKVLDLKWIDGSKPDITLNAPKGMAVLNGVLYVADVDAVRMFDVVSGAPKGAVDIKGATFLNDVAAAGDKIYVTDSGLTGDLKSSGTDAVYTIDGAGKVTKLASGAELENPNGVAVIDGNVWVVPFGGKDIYQLVDGKKTAAAGLPTGQLDGIDAVGDGRIVVSSWEGKAVYIGKPGGELTKLVDGVESPADISVDRKRHRLLVPVFTGNAVRFYPIQ